jgi:adenylate cyclase
MQRGWSLAGLGDDGAGIPQMREGLEGWRSTGARVGVTYYAASVADMCLRAGRLEETAEMLAEATPVVDANDEHFYEPELCRIAGELCRARGEAGAAIAHFERGAAIARALQARAWELRLCLSRARVLAAEGETKRAAAELGEALSWFAEGHDTADLRAASDLRRALLGGPASGGVAP